MRIGDTYVGLGEGDRSPEIVKLKALLKRKFTPARNTLDDGDLFTPELTAVGEGFAAVKAAFDAIMFLSANPNPHYSTFATPGDVEWMRGVAA